MHFRSVFEIGFFWVETPRSDPEYDLKRNILITRSAIDWRPDSPQSDGSHFGNPLSLMMHSKQQNSEQTREWGKLENIQVQKTTKILHFHFVEQVCIFSYLQLIFPFCFSFLWLQHFLFAFVLLIRHLLPCSVIAKFFLFVAFLCCISVLEFASLQMSVCRLQVPTLGNKSGSGLHPHNQNQTWRNKIQFSCSSHLEKTSKTLQSCWNTGFL